MSNAGQGRPPMFTPEQVADALRQARGVQAVAARLLGCHRNTVRRYMQEHPQVQEAVGEMRNENLDMAESQLLTAVSRGEPWAVKFYLATQGRDRGYGKVATFEMTDPLRVEHINAEPDPVRIASIVDVLRECGAFERVLGSNGKADSEESVH